MLQDPRKQQQIEYGGPDQSGTQGTGDQTQNQFDPSYLMSKLGNTSNGGSFDFKFNPSWDIHTAAQMADQNAYGGAGKITSDFYPDIWAKDPAYWWDRAIGKGAGKQDAAVAGPWAGGDPSAMSASSSYSGGSSYQPGQLAQSPQAAELFGMLMNRAKQGETIDGNDPNVRAQSDAYRANQERSMRDYLGDVAEKAGPDANIGAERRLAAERLGSATGGFEANLIGQRIEARRQEIQQALQGAQGLLTSEQQLELQRELGLLNNAESRYQFDSGLGQRESEFSRNLGQRAYEFDTNQDYLYSPFGPSY